LRRWTPEEEALLGTMSDYWNARTVAALATLAESDRWAALDALAVALHALPLGERAALAAKLRS
jgi:hypothetical protein